MKISAPFELVIFGGLGDLSLRKLLPTLYFLEYDQRLDGGRIVCLTRKNLERKAFLKQVRAALKEHVDSDYFDEAVCTEFDKKLQSVVLDVNKPEDFDALKTHMQEDINRTFYLSTGSNLFETICENLSRTGCIQSLTKVVLEKPIGHDHDSAKHLTKAVSQYFNEDQIYRIDHYLGKETVQNLLVLRFANSLFESQWNHKYIDHIQITISEQLGVEKRAGFYEGVGALRDMFQNHLLQLLCITAMEPPASLDPDAIRDEKVKVIKALRPISGSQVPDKVVLGQYITGVSEGKKVPSYREEEGVNKKSRTDTFVAAKIEIDNWRWAGVPFYLRTGKRLPDRACEIVVQFKTVPHSIFPMQNKQMMANQLVFRLQPDEGVKLTLCEKKMGPGMAVRKMDMSLNEEGRNETRVPEAYERLLFDVMSSKPTLFLRDDELLEAWKWMDPIFDYYDQLNQRPETYPAGTWGPSAATLLLAKDGRLWDKSHS